MAQISIIIRTKNEEKWIGHCLAMIEKQSLTDFEIILVDNESTDHTVEIAKRYNLRKIVNIQEFRPGNAINEGIKVSSGEYIVCLSAHCIPKDVAWLATLRRNFDTENNIAGVYGRQLPVSYTDPVDKRDLLLVFGRDRRLQIKDYFFHNANSMFRRDVWDSFPFDEEVTNIEDRVWGKQVIEAGYQIAYDPDASAYHYHGLHQGNTPKRVKGVVSIIERVDKVVLNDLPDSLHPENVHIAAVLPVRGNIDGDLAKEKALKQVVNELKAAKYVNSIYLVSDSQDLADRVGAELILRSMLKDIDSVSIDELIRQSLDFIETKSNFPESLLYVNYEYPYRPDNFFDELIFDAQFKGCDTVFAGLVDYGHYWYRSDEDYKSTEMSLRPRTVRQPVFRALYGLGCVTSSELIRKGNIVGGKIGILQIKDEGYASRLKKLDG